ncbi:predicted protein, partial [Mycobacterium tuberculosis T46]
MSCSTPIPWRISMWSRASVVAQKATHRRIKEGRMIEFVIERLSLIPESKKAVVVFPTYEDYAAVMRNHRDDYLPCLVSIQFRLLPDGKDYVFHTTFYSRSMAAWQKGHGNLCLSP